VSTLKTYIRHMSAKLGAIYTAALFSSAAWILVYTLLPIRPVDALGGWNYVIALALLATTALMSLLLRRRHAEPDAMHDK
jgi:hypothetical protein